MRAIDETGNRYGRLVVVGRASLEEASGVRNKAIRALWKCLCDCGSIKIALGSSLRSGAAISCGCRKIIDEQGKVYGKWLVLGLAENPYGTNFAYWLCRCACGKEKTVLGTQLRSGVSTSCGCCYRPILKTKDGRTKHSLYNIWSGIITRCYNKEDSTYRWYGGVGVSVAPEWHDPFSFYTWIEENLGARPEGYSLDRINVYGNYEPGNIRWASSEEQVNNRRLILLSEEEYELIMRLRAKQAAVSEG